MANFDEDIRRITNELLSDGTAENIIREQLTKGMENAIKNSFNYGKLEKAIKERVEQVLVPFIEGYDMNSYIVKLDTVLSEIVQKSALVDNKAMLENFAFMMTEPAEKEIKITHIFREYKKYVARKMETYGRKVEWDSGEPEYEAMEVCFEFIEEEERRWSSWKYGTIDLTVDDKENQEELNRTIRLSRWENDKKEGWEIRTDAEPNIYSLRYMDEFDLFLAKLQKANVRVIIDEGGEEDCVYSDSKPEPTYE